ncbi:hypothetical protein D1007_34036 [Hordeum vulgare]|nr:hypothetical protein D1007_34036 [Hordeum vulgare]
MASRRRVEESVWVADVDAALSDHDPSREAAQWQWHCIYRVPACIKHLNLKAYQPQVVSLGPFHHGEPHLLPMDIHKRRSLLHLLRRARKPLSEFVVAVAGVAEQLEGGVPGPRRRLATRPQPRGGEEGEVPRDDGHRRVLPAGGDEDGVRFRGERLRAQRPRLQQPRPALHRPYIRRDMIMIENQLPLLVLHKLLAVETGKDGVYTEVGLSMMYLMVTDGRCWQQNEDLINRMVQRFLSPAAWPPATGVGLALHPWTFSAGACSTAPRRRLPPRLRITRSRTTPSGPLRSSTRRASVQAEPDEQPPRHQLPSWRAPPAGHLGRRHTEYMLLNLMAFERLHAGAGNEVTPTSSSWTNMIDTARGRGAADLQAYRPQHCGQ